MLATEALLTPNPLIAWTNRPARFFGVAPLGSSVHLAIPMSNTGGASDNSKNLGQMENDVWTPDLSPWMLNVYGMARNVYRHRDRQGVFPSVQNAMGRTRRDHGAIADALLRGQVCSHRHADGRSSNVPLPLASATKVAQTAGRSKHVSHQKTSPIRRCWRFSPAPVSVCAWRVHTIGSNVEGHEVNDMRENLKLQSKRKQVSKPQVWVSVFFFAETAQQQEHHSIFIFFGMK